MSELSKAWFEEAKRLQIGQSILIRVADKKEQTELAREFEGEKEILFQIDPVHASQLFISKTLIKMKQYVVIERKYRVIYEAFFKDGDKISKIKIDPERRRQLSLMLKDKCTREQIEDALNGLTEEEVKQYFEGDK